MNSRTEELINRIQEELFTEQEKGLLSYTVGQTTMTIAKQLEMLYGNLFPAYNINKCMLIAANIVRNNRRLMLILMKEQQLLDQLTNPDNFKSLMSTENTKEVESRHRTLRDIQSTEEDIASLKNREGTAARSFDYINQESKWRDEDKKELTSDISLSFKKIQGQDIKTLSILEPQAPTEPATPDTNSIYIEQVREEENAYYNQIGVFQTGSKNNRKAKASIDSFRQLSGNDKTDRLQTKSTQAINVMNVFNLDLPNLRSRFFNAFYVLFRKYPACL